MKSRGRRSWTGWISALLIASMVLPASASQQVNFSFDQADIRLIVKMVGDLTGRRFILDDEVKGKVTVVTPQQIDVGEVYPLLLSILESSGYTVLERTDGIHVVPLAPRNLTTGRVVTEEEPEGEGLITKVLRIQHISAVELAKMIEPLVRGGKEGAVSAFGATNHLILTDTADAIRQIEKLIAELDLPGASRMIEVIRLEHASAEEVARQLEQALEGTSTPGDNVARHMQRVADGYGSLPGGMAVVPAIHANSLVVVGSGLQIAEVKRIVAEIDIEAPPSMGRLNAIFLQYISAEEAATTLNKLLEKGVAKDGSREISLEHNAANNALIVDASPQDFDLIRRLVEELDKAPEQVMVEVLIAEITMGDSMDIGMELTAIDQPSDNSVTVIGRSRPDQEDSLTQILADSLFPQGLSIGLAKGVFTDSDGNTIPRVPILLRALAQDRQVDILSNIPLWAQNNTEASVSVVENIPILSSRIEGTGDNRDVIQNIERVDVGIKLTLTPHVNPRGEVKLKLNPRIEAIVDEGPSDTAFAPSIAKREVSTTVTIPDQATVIISGLIREDRIEQISKVPLLGDLPLIGWLFKSKSTQKQRTNLLIFVTPHIVTRLDDANALRQALQKTTSIGEDRLSPVTLDLGEPTTGEP